MINVEHIEQWRGQQVLDPAGEQLGKLEEVYLDETSGTPMLISVKSGLLGRRSKLVPIDGATVGRDYVRVAHDKGTIDASPDASGDASPDAAALDQLGAAYGLKFSDRVVLETSAVAEARRAEAQAARERADQLAEDARDKSAARDVAQERAEGATDHATQAEREAEEANQAALKAREEAQRFEHD
ncbi:MAG: PRC-barrel domain-containing protein [Solirubrobacteraceae bacterium]